MSNSPRVGIFIDGPNLSLTLKLLKAEIDYKRILQYFGMKGTVIRAYYFSIVDPEPIHQNIQPLIDWLDYNGFSVVTKAGRDSTDSMGRRKLVGRMDVELAITALEMADRMDHMVLFSGSADYRAAIRAVQRKGVRATVVSTMATSPAVISDELRRQADEFLDLATLMPIVGREPSERKRAVQAAHSDFTISGPAHVAKETGALAGVAAG